MAFDFERETLKFNNFFKNIMIFITHFVFFSFRFRANSLVFIDNT
ncbi:Uncharacterised protein [Klebsiella pneumoniae]|nr:Uncharacterised protein [Klebsiella pneumoniae]